MEAIRKQASKLREQVAKQQQAVLKQFSGRFAYDLSPQDEAELQCHQKLQALYSSTRAAKHLQRDIVRGVEAFISLSSKQLEILRKLAQDCCKFGDEYQSYGYALSRASSDFANSHNLIEMERENLLKTLGEQVYEPLRSMIVSAPLEDARHLNYRYERISQDVEAQTAEVLKRQLRSKEVSATVENAAKLQNAEYKLSGLRSSLSALGREATEAMLSVEAQQQDVTFQRLLAMVDAERLFHQNASMVLDKLYTEMVQLKQHEETVSKLTSDTKPKIPASNIDTKIPNVYIMDTRGSQSNVPLADSNYIANEGKTNNSGAPQAKKNTVNLNRKVDHSREISANGQNSTYYVAEVIHSFDAQTDGELSISIGDFVVVRQVAPTGWSEGECKGKAGWFPSAYIEKREKAPVNKVLALLSY